MITLTHFGYVKENASRYLQKAKTVEAKGITGLATRENDFCKKQIFTASTHDTLLFFSNKRENYIV